MSTVDEDRKKVQDPDALRHVQGEAITEKHNDVRRTLDMLRATRASRGGVGAPLQTPGNLSVGALVVVTDADLDPNKAAQINPRERNEEDRDARAELIRKGVIDADDQ